MRIALSPARHRQSYNVQFVEPFFFGHEVQFSANVGRIIWSRESWDVQRTGGAVSFSKRWRPFFAGMRFEVQDFTYSDIESSAPVSVRRLEGDNLSCTIAPFIGWDTRDSFVFPTRGLHAKLTYEYTGQTLPGDFDHDRYLFTGETFFPLYETDSGLFHVLALQTSLGWVHGKRRQDEVLNIEERFHLGGRSSMRGFDFRGISILEDGDPVGGEVKVLASAEYVFPIFSSFLRGAAFVDAGTIEDEIADMHKSKFRYAWGVGLRFIIPQMGNIPIALDFGWPLWKDDDDDTRVVTFDIGSMF